MAGYGTNQTAGKAAGYSRTEGRGTPRLPLACRLTYSGRRGKVILVGEGLTVDVSLRGFGVRGNQPVCVGMLLSLCLQVPSEPSPLFIEEARVIWVRKRRFGIALHRLTLKSRSRLNRLLRSGDAAVLKSDCPLSVQVRWT